MATIVDYLGGLMLPGLPVGTTTEAARDALAAFRTQFHTCLTARADALFELTDALLCTHGPVTSLSDYRWPQSTAVVTARCMTR